MIKWVCFDLDDTLFNGTLLVEKARRASIQMMVEYGLPIEEEYALKLLNEIVLEFGSNSESHLDNLILRLRHDPKIKLSLDFNINKYAAAGIIGYHREKVKHFKLFKDVVKVFQKLHKMGLYTAIITDGSPKKQYEKILRLKLENLVDEIVISDEVAARKPNPFLFSHFIEDHKIKSQEVIYIGDRVDKDIVPAKEAGLWTILIHRGTKYDPNISKQKFNVKPDFHVNNLYDLEEIIEQINKKEINSDSIKN
ncbi:MAG: TIGR02253 family HAD-type hydrolase [Promethearchaeota archaeon]